jgi:hypothetical protein
MGQMLECEFNRIQPALDRTQPAIQCEKRRDAPLSQPAPRHPTIGRPRLEADLHTYLPPKLPSPKEKIIFIEPTARNNLLLPNQSGASAKREFP